MSNIVPFQDMQLMAKAIADSRLFGLTDVNQVLARGANNRLTPFLS
jgi:hypothetical protein